MDEGQDPSTETTYSHAGAKSFNYQPAGNGSKRVFHIAAFLTTKPDRALNKALAADNLPAIDASQPRIAMIVLS